MAAKIYNHPMAMEEHNHTIFWMVAMGATLQMVADKHGISRERVRQIAIKEQRRRKHEREQGN